VGGLSGSFGLEGLGDQGTDPSRNNGERGHDGERPGSRAWDGSAPIAIGVLLVVVAVRLGAGSRELLIGRAAGDEQQRLIRTEIEATSGVDALVELLTMHLGPESLIVGARIDLDNDLSASDAEALADRIDSRLAQMLPVSPHVFLDPTRRSER
jgi:divalent metal cation (Fe/Co/Zn/Cd) transporter